MKEGHTFVGANQSLNVIETDKLFLSEINFIKPLLFQSFTLYVHLWLTLEK